MKKTIASNKYLSLLAWLKDARLSKDLTMRDLAALIDEEHQFIGKIETAERRLDIFEYVQYCEALGVNPIDGIKYLQK